MDKHADSTKPVSRIEPPKETRTSIVLNSVGNGMMLGGIPFIGIEAYALMRKSEKPLPMFVRAASIGAAVVGGILGWISGEKEANRLQKYRHQLADELASLREDVNEIKTATRWQRHVSKPAQEVAAAADVDATAMAKSMVDKLEEQQAAKDEAIAR